MITQADLMFMKGRIFEKQQETISLLKERIGLLESNNLILKESILSINSMKSLNEMKKIIKSKEVRK